MSSRSQDSNPICSVLEIYSNILRCILYFYPIADDDHFQLRILINRIQFSQWSASTCHLGNNATLNFIHLISVILYLCNYFPDYNLILLARQTKWSGNPKGLWGPLKGGLILEFLSARLNFT
jgi:hypothetical protein